MLTPEQIKIVKRNWRNGHGLADSMVEKLLDDWLALYEQLKDARAEIADLNAALDRREQQAIARIKQQKRQAVYEAEARREEQYHEQEWAKAMCDLTKAEKRGDKREAKRARERLNRYL